MDKFIIETTIDKLLKILREKKKLPISEALRLLNIEESQLESWIGALEDRGIVELKYPVLGEPEIVLKGEVPEELAEELITKELEKPIEEFEEKPEVPTYADVVEKLKSLENRISKIASQRAKEATPESLRIIEKLKFLENKIHELSKEIDEEEKKIYETEKPLLEKIETIENRLAEISKEKKIISETKDISERFKAIEDKMSSVIHEIDTTKFKGELFEVLLIMSTLNNKEKISFYLNFFERLIKIMKVNKIWDEIDEELMRDMMKAITENWRTYKQEELAKLFEEWLEKNK